MQYTVDDWMARRKEEGSCMAYALCPICWRAIRFDWDDTEYGPDTSVCVCPGTAPAKGDDVLEALGIRHADLVIGRFKKSGESRRD